MQKHESSVEVLIVDSNREEATRVKSILAKEKITVARQSEIDSVLTRKDSSAHLLIWVCLKETAEEVAHTIQALRESYRFTDIYIAVPLHLVRLGISGLDSGAAGYLLYPFQPAELIRILNHWRIEKSCQDALQKNKQQAFEILQLQKVNGLINLSYDADEVLKLIADSLFQIMGTGSSVVINIYDRMNQRLVTRAVAGNRADQIRKTPPRPDGISNQVIQQSKIVVLNNALNNPVIHEVGRSEVHAVMAVPVLDQERTIGSIYIDSIAPREFQDSDENIVVSFAAQASIALRKKRMVTNLTEIVTQLPTQIDKPSQIFNSVCQSTAQLMEADSCCILRRVRDGKEDILRIVGAFGLTPEMVSGTRDRIGESIAGRVVANRAPIITNDVPNDRRFKNPAAANDKLLAIVSVPIWHGKDVIGTLDIHSQTRTNVFSEPDLQILELVAHQAAVAIVNAELLDRLQRLTASVPDGVIGIDARGYIVEFNKQAERLLGYNSNTAKRKHISELYTGGIEEAREIQAILLQDEKGQISDYDSELVSASGQNVPIRFSAHLHYAVTGQPQGSFGYFNDRRQFRAVDELTESYINATEEMFLSQQIADILARNLAADICVLLRYDHRANDFVIRAISSFTSSEKLINTHLSFGGNLQQTISSRQPLCGSITSQVEEEIRDICELIAPFSRFQKLSNFLLIPLIHHGNTIGLLMLFNKLADPSLGNQGFTSADEILLTTLGQQIVGLLQRTVHSATMKALFEISAEIATIHNEKDILQKIVDVLVGMIGYRAAYFRVKNSNDDLIIRAIAGANEKYVNNPDYKLKTGLGINGRVAEKGEIEVVPDVQVHKDYYYSEIAHEEGLRGMIVAPVYLDKELIGTLSCYTGQPHYFTPEDKQLVTTFANLTAVTIERERQFEEINQRADEIERLHTIGQIISAELNLPDVINSIVRNILDLVGAKDVHFYLYDHQIDELQFGASYWSTGEQNVAMAKPRANGLTKTVARTGQKIIINSPKSHKLFADQPWSITAIGGFPIKSKDKVVGVLNIAFEDGKMHFNEKQVFAIETIANQAAVALANAQLFEEINLQVNELRELAQAGETLAPVVQLEKTLTSIVETAVQITQAAGAYCMLYDETSSQFDLDRDASFGIGSEIAIWEGKQPQKNNVIDKILNEEIVYVENVSTLLPIEIHESGKQELLRAGIKAFVGIRLNIGNNSIGVLFLNYSEIMPKGNRVKSKPVLRIFAKQAAVAIERACLFERLEQQQALGRVVAKTTGSVMDPWTTIANEILSGAMQIIGADRGYISALNERSGQLEFVVHIINGKRQPGTLTPINKRVENRVKIKKASVRIDDVRRRSWYPQLEHSEVEPRLSHLAVPIFRKIKKGSEVIGIIYLECLRPRKFSLDDRKLLEDLAIQATIAYQNANSYEDARQQVQNLELLLKITQQITSFRLIKDELKEIAEELHVSHGFDLVTIHLYDPYQQTFEPPIVAGKTGSMEPQWLLRKGGLEWRRLQEGPEELFVEDAAKSLWLAGPFIRQEKIVSAGSVRLRIDKQVVGILGIYKRSPFIFDNTTRSTIQASAKNLSTLIYHSSILQSIVDGLHGVMGFDVITLFLYDAIHNELSKPVVAGEMYVPDIWSRGGLINESLWKSIQDKNIYFTEDSLNDPVLSGDFVKREKVAASGFVRLAVGGETVGVLFVNWRHGHHWTQAEKYAVQLFADGAAIAIQNMHQVNAQEKKQRQLHALYEAGWTVVKAGLNLDVVLETILELAVGETGAHFGTLQLIEDNEFLSFAAVWPKDRKDSLQQVYGRMSLDASSITARAVRENDAQLVPDVALDKDFLDVTGETRSELAVIIRQENEPLGVLNVEHRDLYAFNAEDRELLIGFTNLAALALKNAKQFQEVEKAKSKQLATQAVAWLGLFGANWQHTINQKIFSISNYVTGLNRLLENNTLTKDTKNVIATTLTNIESVANSIRTVQIPGQVSPNMSESRSSRMDLDEQLPGIVNRWVRRKKDIEVQYHCHCPGIVIGISEQWFQVIMEKLINNSIKAMPGGGKIILRTQNVGRMACIEIKDTGNGIPDYAREHFLHREIPRREGEPGSGMGVLIANFVALCHEGEITLVASSAEEGTTLQLFIPAVEAKGIRNELINKESG